MRERELAPEDIVEIKSDQCGVEISVSEPLSKSAPSIKSDQCGVEIMCSHTLYPP